MSRTLVHLMRHGEVHNPDGILYGQLPGYHLSDLGQAMASSVAVWFRAHNADLRQIVASPLERAQETARPISDEFGVPITTDPRVIEGGSRLQGLAISKNPALLASPKYWKLLRNPLVPSWGEPYVDQVSRMVDAIRDAKRACAGGEALIVSHQSPIYLTRLWLEGRRLVHDPRRRQCTLASVTTLTFDGSELIGLDYSEPAGNYLAEATAIT